MGLRILAVKIQMVEASGHGRHTRVTRLLAYPFSRTPLRLVILHETRAQNYYVHLSRGQQTRVVHFYSSFSDCCGSKRSLRRQESSYMLCACCTMMLLSTQKKRERERERGQERIGDHRLGIAQSQRGEESQIDTQ